MRYSRFDAKSFIIRIEKEEEVISALQSFCKEKRIGNAFFWGIGSIQDPILAHYNPHSKKYTEKKLTGIFELIILHGNACWYHNDILIHAHVSIGNQNMNVFGGHLVSCRVAATTEIFLVSSKTKHTKIFDPEIGLKVWDFREKI